MNSTAGYYLAPGNFELLMVTGPDSARFLQGQLTCDVQALAPWCCTPGAVCTNKGRVIATFTLCRLDAEYAMVMASGLAGPLQKHLDRYRPFYKCSLAPAQGPLTGLCLSGHSPADLALPPVGGIMPVDSGWVCSMPGATRRLMHCASGDSLSAWLDDVLAGLSVAPAVRWQADDLESGIFPFSAADSERYTPQEIHLDRRDFVSFSKGCYTGQEIVARMHYKSRPKKQLYLLSLNPADAETLHTGLQVCNGAGEPVGESMFQVMAADGQLLALAQLPLLGEAEISSLKTGNGLPLTARVF
jgi:folate-binding protein YgfZ